MGSSSNLPEIFLLEIKLLLVAGHVLGIPTTPALLDGILVFKIVYIISCFSSHPIYNNC